jgi:hypothetical protein
MLRRAQRYGLPLQKALISAHAEAEDRKLRKDPFLEVLALKVPFRNLLVFPNQAPWPGRLGGTQSLTFIDAGRARELQKSAQPATQMLSVNCLYQMNAKWRKGHFVTGHESLPSWFLTQIRVRQRVS